MAVFEIDNWTPRIAASAWIAESAQVIGNVIIEDEVSIWPGVVIRGDHDEPIRIGKRSNIQECSVLHADPGSPLTIGEDVTVGHKAMLHGCTVGNGSLVGIGAIVLNNAQIGAGSLVGAGALVTEGKTFESGQLIVGSPARAVRELRPEQIAGLIRSAAHYVENGQRFKRGLRRID